MQLTYQVLTPKDRGKRGMGFLGRRTSDIANGITLLRMTKI